MKKIKSKRKKNLTHRLRYKHKPIDADMIADRKKK